MILAVDIDGTLCYDQHSWWEYSSAKPILKNIQKINELFSKGHTIILYTARYKENKEVTLEWLAKHNVKYHEILFSKLRADIYIDDASEKLSTLEVDSIMTVLLYSGGLDSYIAWEYLGRPKTIYCELNHVYQHFEEEAISKTIPNTVLDNSLSLARWEKPDAEIPMRNAFMLMVASYYGDKLCLVVQKGEMSIPDRSQKFFATFGETLSQLNNRKIEIFSPFFDMTKSEMVGWYIKKGLPISKLLDTRSCYSGGSKPCGACSACFRRWVAFKVNGFEEEMTHNILQWEGTKEYIDNMKLGKYDKKRTEETLAALRIAGVEV
jgi:7-cyano-7-deazaguanine synthase